MEKIIEKMDSYNIFNYLLPGAIFDYMFEILFHMKLVQGNIVENLFVYYFLGMILSRIGSIIIEPICKKIGLNLQITEILLKRQKKMIWSSYYRK